MILNHNRLKWPLIIVFIIWVFFAISIFYVVQKPFLPQDLILLAKIAQSTPFSFSIVAVGRTVLDILATVWLSLLSLGLGNLLYQKLTNPVNCLSHPLEEIIFSLGLGFGILSLLGFFMGLLGLISQAIIYSVLIVLSLAISPHLIKSGQAFYKTHAPLHPLTKLSKPLKLYFFITLSLALSLALLPPIDWDGLVYHLVAPKLHLAVGQIKPGIDIPASYFPAFFESLFLFAMAIKGDIVAKLLHFEFLLLLAAIVYLIAHKHLGLKQGWWAVILLFSIPMVLTLSGWAYTDLPFTFYQLAALYMLLYAHPLYTNPSSTTDLPATTSTAQMRLILLSGVFCGFTMGLKYISAIVPVVLGLLLLWWYWQDGKTLLKKANLPKNFKVNWLLNSSKGSLIFGVSAIVVASPWYIKNWFFTGNPFYPFIFGGTFWDEFRMAVYASTSTGTGFDIKTLLTLPYLITIGTHDANYFDGRVGPLFLAFLPILLLYALFRYRRTKFPYSLDYLLIFAGTQFAFWTFGAMQSQSLWQSRHLLPILAILCPVLAWILEDISHLNHRQFSLHRFLNLVISVVLLLGLTDQLFNNHGNQQMGWLFHRPYLRLLGSESEEDYLKRRLGVHYGAIMAINNQLPPKAVITFLWEPRSYYCKRDCRPDNLLDKYTHLYYLHQQNPKAIIKNWHQQGITHVLVYDYLLNRILETAPLDDLNYPDLGLINELKANHSEGAIDIGGIYQIYRLK